MNKSKQYSSERLYKQLFGPILAQDEGVDAEQITNIILNNLGQASINYQANLNSDGGTADINVSIIDDTVEST